MRTIKQDTRAKRNKGEVNLLGIVGLVYLGLMVIVVLCIF